MEATQPEIPEAAGAVPGAAIGRFIIERELGAGGMGVVYVARDPVLDRRVAVKLLRAGGGVTGETRLLREAQALARLTDPNVVTVYEAGIAGNAVYLAMELVDGTTLREWSATPRSWREVVQVYIAAGRGLAAAHAAGMVHRDFKPANVFIDRAGRVKVGDFGLVGAEDSAGVGAIGGVSTTITDTGGIMGTPAYMAPEQSAGESIDARADQYAFCKSLREALGGATPVEPIVARGLSQDRVDRYATMTALLADLERALHRRRRYAIGVAAIAIAGVAVSATFLASRHAPEDPCARSDERLAGVWDAAQRGAARAHVLSIDPNHGPAAFAAIAPVLDAYAEGWRTMARDACRANRITHIDSDTLYDRRTRCLDRRRTELVVVTSTVAAAKNLTRLDSAIAGVSSLTDLAACADAEALLAATPPPEDVAARREVDALTTELDAINTARRAGILDGIEARSTAVIERARKVKYAPTLASALHMRIDIMHDFSNRPASAPLLRELTEVAAAGHDDAEAAWAWAELLTVTAADLRKPEEAIVLIPAARAALARAGDKPTARVNLLYSEGSAYGAVSGHEAEALARYAEAKTVLIAQGAEKPGSTLTHRLGDVVWATARMSLMQHDLDAAIPLYRRSIELWKMAFGPDHPDVAWGWIGLADSLRWSGKTSEALEAYREAIRIRESRLGESPSLADLLVNFTSSLVDAKLLPEAERTIARALKILRAADLPIETAVALMVQGLVLDAQGKLDETRTSYDAAIAIFEAKAPTDINYPTTIFNRGDLETKRGHCDKALVDYTRALELFSKLLGDQHPNLAFPLTAIGKCHVVLRDPVKAIASLDRALAIPNVGPPILIGSAKFYRGRAVYESGRDRAKGLAAAKAARAELDALGAEGAPLVAEADEWLKAK